MIPERKSVLAVLSGLALLVPILCEQILLEGRYQGEKSGRDLYRNGYYSYPSDSSYERNDKVIENNSYNSRNMNTFSDLLQRLSSVIHNQLVQPETDSYQREYYESTEQGRKFNAHQRSKVRYFSLC